MIPKKIHYCWFGKKEKSLEIKKFIKTWENLNGYEIIEWNEDNFDFSESYYAKKAFKMKKWAFLSDYVRLKVLYKYGGIYLDTDVEIKKNFDDEFLKNNMFISFMFNCNLSTAIIGAEKENNVIKKLLEIYNDKELIISPNNDLFTRFFIENFNDFKLNNRNQLLREGVMVYQKEYFECPSISKYKGYSIHHFNGSWRKETKLKKYSKKVIKGIIGTYLYQNIVRFKAIYKSPFRYKYINDRKLNNYKL